MRFLVLFTLICPILCHCFDFVKTIPQFSGKREKLYMHLNKDDVSFEMTLSSNIMKGSGSWKYPNFTPIVFLREEDNNSVSIGIFTLSIRGDADSIWSRLKSKLHSLPKINGYSYYWNVDIDRKNICIFKKRGRAVAMLNVKTTNDFSMKNKCYLFNYISLMDRIQIIDDDMFLACRDYLDAHNIITRDGTVLLSKLSSAANKGYDRAKDERIFLLLQWQTKDKNQRNEIFQLAITYLTSEITKRQSSELLGIMALLVTNYKEELRAATIEVGGTKKNTFSYICDEVRKQLKQTVIQILPLYAACSKQWRQFSSDPWRHLTTEEINLLLKSQKKQSSQGRSGHRGKVSSSFSATTTSDSFSTSTPSSANGFTEPMKPSPAPSAHKFLGDSLVSENDSLPPLSSPPAVRENVFAAPLTPPPAIRENVFGPGIHQNQFGQPVKYHVPNWPSNEPTQFLQVKPNVYGPGIGQDQFGRPVTVRPAF